jgi:hypothetical protein
MAIPSKDVLRIYVEVLLDTPAPEHEPLELREFREAVTRSVEEAVRRGWFLEVPND